MPACLMRFVTREWENGIIAARTDTSYMAISNYSGEILGARQG